MRRFDNLRCQFEKDSPKGTFPFAIAPKHSFICVNALGFENLFFCKCSANFNNYVTDSHQNSRISFSECQVNSQHNGFGILKHISPVFCVKLRNLVPHDGENLFAESLAPMTRSCTTYLNLTSSVRSATYRHIQSTWRQRYRVQQHYWRRDSYRSIFPYFLSHKIDQNHAYSR